MEMVIVILLLAIVASLGQALFSMSSPQANSKSMVNALTVRIGLSVALFALLFIGAHFGWIQPHQVHH
ncbi:MAG: twin transmembrane helix small protein [Steroidobacteraceae bacterium]